MFGYHGFLATMLAGTVAAAASFGGVNHYFLAAVDQSSRKSIIQALHNSGTRVIRTFVRPVIYTSEKGNSKTTWPDVESSMGAIASPISSVLDYYDDMLHEIHTISGGRMKVLLSLHDANMIAGHTQPCDAYCEYMRQRGLDWRNFYTDSAIRSAFKFRLRSILQYRSKNFGRLWAQLSEAILAIDLENEPGVGGRQDYVIGTGWTCDVSRFLRGILSGGIGVATGAIGGALSGSNNFPDEVFSCDAVDIISLHG
jgi:mannan endo-1,4-beta-mannosidase